MAIQFSVKADVKRVLRSLNAAQRTVVPAAVPAALNRAVKQTQTASVRESAATLHVKQKIMRQRLRFQRRDRASKRYWEAGVFTVLSDLKASDLGTIRQQKTGAKAGRYTFPGAFRATMPGGHESAWKRTGPKRFPIREQRIDIRAQVERIVEKNIRTVGMPAFRKRFYHEMNYRLRRLGL
jgi:hypothetical protein